MRIKNYNTVASKLFIYSLVGISLVLYVIFWFGGKLMVDYVEGIDYTFIEVNETPGIKILSTDFENVIYTYSNVSASESSENDENYPLILSFNYTVIFNADYTSEEFETLDFKNKIGDILTAIIQNSVEKNIEPESSYIEEPEL